MPFKKFSSPEYFDVIGIIENNPSLCFVSFQTCLSNENTERAIEIYNKFRPVFECGKSDVLNACISNGNLELFIKEFEYGADIRRYDIKEEARPLYEAVMSSRYDIVKFLVLQGVYIDQKTKNYIINDIEIGKSIGMVTQEEKNLLNLLTNLDYCGNRLSVAILCLREILRLPKQLIEKVLFYLHEDPTHLKLVK